MISPEHSPPHTPKDQDDGDRDGNGAGDNEPILPDPWADYNTNSRTGNDPDLYPMKPSPPDDSVGYIELLGRTANYHGVQLHKESLEEDFLFETLGSTQRSSHTLPMLMGMIRHVDDIFSDPVRARILTPRVDKKYKPAPSDPAYIKGQLPLDSLVVSNARKRDKSQTT